MELNAEGLARKPFKIPQAQPHTSEKLIKNGPQATVQKTVTHLEEK